MNKTYDKACYELAETFLCDASGIGNEEIPAKADLLAKEIQQCIEDFFAAHNLE